MRQLFLTSLATLSAAFCAAGSIDLYTLGQKLSDIECYSDTCRYEVLLASLSEPVDYGVYLSSGKAASDTLAPCNYYIRWSADTPGGTTSGFSAYFDGSHFRFRDKRLQEYHVQENSEVFAPGGDIDRGVQNQAQFADILPQYIGRKFMAMATDSSYHSTITLKGSDIVVKGVRRYAGYDANEYEYLIDAESMHPKHISLELNPGQIGEQSIVVSYLESAASADCHISLAKLSAIEHEAFERYRESTFSLANLPGRPLPEISALTISADRYYHRSGKPLDSPAILIFVDAAVASTPDLIKDVRRAISEMPKDITVIWAFIDHRADDVTNITGSPMPDETVIINASGAARACGVGRDTPVMIFVNSDGIVTDIAAGYNQEVCSIVIEKAARLH